MLKARTAAAAVLNTTRRSPAAKDGGPKISNGACVPLWMFVEDAFTVPVELTRKRS